MRITKIRQSTLSVIVITGLFLLALSTNASATPMEKLKKGVKELFSSPLEIPLKTAEYIEEIDNKLIAIPVGILAGGGKHDTKSAVRNWENYYISF